MFTYDENAPETKREKIMPKKPILKTRPLPIQNFQNSIPKLAVKRLYKSLMLIDDHIMTDTVDCSEQDFDTKSVISVTSRSKSQSSFYNYQNMVCRQQNRKVSKPKEIQEPMIIRKEPQKLSLVEVTTFDS